MPRTKEDFPSPKTRAGRVVRALERLYPAAECALVHRNPFELIVATILSAQCTDARVNLVTPALFARFPDAHALATGSLTEVEELIRSTGFFRSKAKNLVAMATQLVERHGGQVPADHDALTALPGVGRKTASVVLGVAFSQAEGVVVDTHVKRLAYRLGLTTHKDPARIERDLMASVPRKQWIALSHRLILHGRRTCNARQPRCADCELDPICPKNGVRHA
ncbi:MAG: endonuclease III [Isosphaeraceae bacterium]|nr:endonuclease III [Isosphaeraceae bacterium]